MPGHKGTPLLGIEAFDITEIDGADELFTPSGVIAESEKKCSEIAAKNAEDVKNAYKATIKEYAEKAEADYERTMEESVAAGERLSSDKKSAIDNQAEIICGRLLNGDC